MILSLVFGFIGGIALGSLAPINLGFFLVLVFLGAIFYIYQFFVEGQSRSVMLFASIAMLGVLCGIGRMYFSDLYTSSQLDKYADHPSTRAELGTGQGKISVEGIIVTEPDVREKNTKLTMRVTKVNGESLSRSEPDSTTGEKILVSVPIYPEFHYGDKVKMTVTLVTPQNIENEDGRVFDYKGYLRVRGIWYTSKFTTIKLVSGGHGAIVKNILFRIKRVFTNSLDNVLPQPESSLMAGLLLGTKQSLGKEILSEFQRTGTSHVVVLSGYNIAIVATSIMSFFKFLPKNLSFGFGVTGIILFTVLSGGGASASRAAIMVLVALLAKKMNRDYKIGRVLGFTIVIMLAPNPLLLAFDPSFQLSILATIGIIFVSPLISPYLSKVTERFGLREIISTTIATQITVLPFLIYNTGILSLVSLPVNVLILGTVPVTMLFGFITGIVGMISFYLSFLPAFFAYILLWYQLSVVHLGASLPFGAITLPAFSPLFVVFVYFLLFIGLYFLKKSSS